MAKILLATKLAEDVISFKTSAYLSSADPQSEHLKPVEPRVVDRSKVQVNSTAASLEASSQIDNKLQR